MSILSRLRGFIDRDPYTRAVVKRDVPMQKPLRQQVWEAPATFNRHMRRAAGLLSKYWRWDMQVLGWVQPAPRYIRRHYQADVTTDGPDGLPVTTYGVFTHPKTRRQRRHRARILAIAKRNGL